MTGRQVVATLHPPPQVIDPGPQQPMDPRHKMCKARHCLVTRPHMQWWPLCQRHTAVFLILLNLTTIGLSLAAIALLRGWMP